MRKGSTRHRMVMYAIIITGLGLMELFRSRLTHHLGWGGALARAGQKILLFLFIFAVIEVVYAVYQRANKK